ncbi:MAG TPA: RNA polymerase sigma factor [Candidatus Limnocylindrales bacterium]|nr:RNA polymerase sigma factor [Candidatus Limnocylindrales bacterium]
MSPDAASSSPPATIGHADDAALVATVLRGDRDVFRVIVEREGPSLVRSCYRILGSREDAEEAAQEAFVIGYRSLGSWRGEGNLGAWLSRIAVRIAIRKAGTRRKVAWIDPTAPTADVERAAIDAGWTRAASTDPARATLAAESAASVRAAVTRLDEPYRETVALRFFGQRSLAEIAAVTGRPLGTVKTHLHRGLTRLRTELEREAAS